MDTSSIEGRGVKPDRPSSYAGSGAPAAAGRDDQRKVLVTQALRDRVRVATVVRGEDPPSEDLVAAEEPLEIRVAGEPVAVIMRTPGDDHRLALGFLFGEGILSSAADVSAVFHCGRPGTDGYGNAIDVAPASGSRIDWARLDGARRSTTTTSACGVCGRRAIDDLLAELEPPPPGPVVTAAAIAAAVETLRHHQPAFVATGGTHVAALWTREGALLAAQEDVGRHNAVDKVVGALLLARTDAPAGGLVPEPGLLAVSSRAGFEVVQKAARARIPIVASVSAATSLAAELAAAAGMTLAGFVRGGRMNVYAGSERIALGGEEQASGFRLQASGEAVLVPGLNPDAPRR
jgi:FdhD protein